MVGTSGVIFPVMGFRRVVRYLVSMASMIFWMNVRPRSRVSKYSFLLNDVCFLRLQFERPCRTGLGQGHTGLVAE